jgi:hypothetical protein
MVERVARALWAANIASVTANAEMPSWDDDMMGDFSRNLYRGYARAAIEAMRGGNDAILEAGYEAMFEDKYDGSQAPMIGAGYDAMIEAALSS